MQYHLENFIFKGACVCMCVGGLMTRYIIEYADTSHSGHKLSLHYTTRLWTKTPSDLIRWF